MSIQNNEKCHIILIANLKYVNMQIAYYSYVKLTLKGNEGE